MSFHPQPVGEESFSGRRGFIITTDYNGSGFCVCNRVTDHGEATIFQVTSYWELETKHLFNAVGHIQSLK